MPWAFGAFLLPRPPPPPDAIRPLQCPCQNAARSYAPGARQETGIFPRYRLDHAYQRL